MKTLLLIAMLALAPAVMGQATVTATLRSTLVWEDTDAQRPDGVGFRITLVNKTGTAVASVTNATTSIALPLLMSGLPDSLYTVTITKLCRGLESDPSQPLTFAWVGGIPKAPSGLSISTTITIP